MFGIALATLAVVGAVVSHQGHKAGEKQARKGIKEQKRLTRESVKIIDDAFAKVEAEYGPWIAPARKAFQQVGADIESGKYSMESFENDFLDPEGYGPPEQYQKQFDADAFSFEFNEDDPSYQWRLEQGQRALANQANASGMAGGGAYSKALIGYNQDMASQEYGAAFDRALRARGMDHEGERLRQSDQAMALDENYRNRAMRLDAAKSLFGQKLDARKFDYGTKMDFAKVGMDMQAGLSRARLTAASEQAGILSGLGSDVNDSYQAMGDRKRDTGDSFETSLYNIGSTATNARTYQALEEKSTLNNR